MTGGPDVDIVGGEEGNDTINWSAGDGSDSWISGGNEEDSFIVNASSINEYILLSATSITSTSMSLNNPDGGVLLLSQPSLGTNVRVWDISSNTDTNRNPDTCLAATSMENYSLNAGGGADRIEVNDLAESGVGNLTIDVGVATHFEAKLIYKRTGTDSGTSHVPYKLTDDLATFSKEVGVGDRVVNTTTGAEATITAIDSDTVCTLSADIMENGNSYSVPLMVPRCYDYDQGLSTPSNVNSTLSSGGSLIPETTYRYKICALDSGNKHIF